MPFCKLSLKNARHQLSKPVSRPCAAYSSYWTKFCLVLLACQTGIPHATCKTQINLAKSRARSGFTNAIAGKISAKLDALGIKCTSQAILFHHSMSSQRSILFKRTWLCKLPAHVSTFCTCSRGPRSPLRRHNRKPWPWRMGILQAFQHRKCTTNQF